MKKESGLTDAQILEEVLNALDYNPNSLNTKLELIFSFNHTSRFKGQEYLE